ncbi:MAG: hypothetical protein QM762_02060 [Chryseolinea sp.]
MAANSTWAASRTGLDELGDQYTRKLYAGHWRNRREAPWAMSLSAGVGGIDLGAQTGRQGIRARAGSQ